jgi:hypothetical protein
MAVLFGAALGGCSREPPPLRTAREIHAEPTTTASVELPAAKPPAKSDPAAVAVVTAALNAHTSNQPALVQKLKTIRLTREGRILIGPQPMKQEIQAQWPDRYRVHAEFTRTGGVITVGWSGETGWKQSPAGSEPIAPAPLKDNQLDISGEWLSLLFPLAEPETIVATVADAEVNKRPAAGVRVWNPHLSDAILHFDKETKLLAQITYDGREQGRKVTKQVIVQSSRPFAGVTLPVQTVIKADGSDLAEWTVTSLDPQSSIDAKVFEKP